MGDPLGDNPTMHSSFSTIHLLLLSLLSSCASAANYSNGTTRTYYVAAVEEDWDYMPTNMDMINGATIVESPQAAAVAGNDGQRIGHIVKRLTTPSSVSCGWTQPARGTRWLCRMNVQPVPPAQNAQGRAHRFWALAGGEPDAWYVGAVFASATARRRTVRLTRGVM